MKEPFVFISYSTKESNEANALLSHLEENGVSCWIAPRDIAVGKDYSEEIPDAISRCAAMVLLVSKSAENSEYVKNEIVTALDHHKVIFPIKMHSDELARAIKFQLARAQWVEATDGIASAFEPILTAVKARIEVERLRVSAGASASKAVKTSTKPAAAEKLTPKIYVPERLDVGKLCDRSVLVLGVGNVGTSAVKLFEEKMSKTAFREKGNVSVVSLALDTDLKEILGHPCVTGVSIRPDNDWEQMEKRMPCGVWDDVCMSDTYTVLDNGLIRTRGEAYAAFLYAMEFPERRDAIDGALKRLISGASSNRVTVYVLASASEAVGSGVCVPLAMYVKRRLFDTLGAEVDVFALLSAPDAASSAEGPRYVRANAYALFRELESIRATAYGRKGGKDIRIGHEKSAVGTLFDSEDKRFWIPSAMPFERVYLQAEESGSSLGGMMASEVYTMACTQLGSELPPRIANAEKHLSHDLSEHRLFVAIGSSEIVYPVDEMFEYFALRNMVCDEGEAFLFLHRLAEAEIAEEERVAKQARKKFCYTTEWYAKKFLTLCRRVDQNEEGAIVEHLRRDTTRFVQRKSDDLHKAYIFDEYWSMLMGALKNTVPSVDEYCDKIASALSCVPCKKDALFVSAEKRRVTAQRLCKGAEAAYAVLQEYYGLAKDAVFMAKRLANRVLSAKAGALSEHGALSFAGNVLSVGDKPIHPASALLQLCELRAGLSGILSYGCGASEAWDKQEGSLPIELLACEPDPYTFAAKWKNADLSSVKKSWYFAQASKRFSSLLTENGAKAYIEAKTNRDADRRVLLADAKSILFSLAREAEEKLRFLVCSALLPSVDALIEGYRHLFFEIEKETERWRSSLLPKAELAKASVRDGAEICVGSSVETRRELYLRFMEELFDGRVNVGDVFFDAACTLAFGEEGEGYLRRGAELVLEKMRKENIRVFSETDIGVDCKRRSVFDVIAAEKTGKDGLLGYLKAADVAAMPSVRRMPYEEKAFRFVLIPSVAAEFFRRNAEMFGASSKEDLRAVADMWFSDGVVIREALVPANTVSFFRFLAPMTLREKDEADAEKAHGCYHAYTELLTLAKEQEREDIIPHLGRGWHLEGRLLPLIKDIAE